MGIVSKFVSLFMGDRRHTATPLDNNLAESATIEIDGDGSIVRVSLNTVIGDGNSIKQVNWSLDGMVMATEDAYPGDENAALALDKIDIGEETLKMSYVDGEGSVVAEDRIKIQPLSA